MNNDLRKDKRGFHVILESLSTKSELPDKKENFRFLKIRVDYLRNVVESLILIVNSSVGKVKGGQPIPTVFIDNFDNFQSSSFKDEEFFPSL